MKWRTAQQPEGHADKKQRDEQEHEDECLVINNKLIDGTHHSELANYVME